MVVLDTCAIIEIVKEKPTFSNRVIQLIDAGCYILSISFAEIACKIKLGKLEMSVSTRELFQRFSDVDNVSIIDIGTHEWLDSVDLIWNENKDPADRIITAFAIKNELPIITTDKRIADFYPKVFW